MACAPSAWLARIYQPLDDPRVRLEPSGISPGIAQRGSGNSASSSSATVQRVEIGAVSVCWVSFSFFSLEIDKAGSSSLL